MINETINYYNNNADEYCKQTQDVKFSDNRNMLLKYLRKGAHILDLGCGSGRDSKAFLELGYDVTLIDGSLEMCRQASKLTGQKAICKEFMDIEYVNEFDYVWACASLLHIPSGELEDVLYKVFEALKSGGYFYLTFKYGEFEGMRNGRFFNDMTEKKFHEIIKKYRYFKVIETNVTSDAREDRKNEKWLNIILKADK